MANRMVYTRAYLKSSEGQFVSRKGPKGDPLSNTALVENFRNHANKRNTVPTALVSGSDRIVDTLKRAGEHYVDGKSPADIWIAFIEVLPTTDENTTRIHSAKDLAEKCQLSDPNKFSHEVVFEWVIPEKYVLHKVSLQTLVKRGLQAHCFLQPSTKAVRYSIARQLQLHGPVEIGIALGVFAQQFGARAPLDWISHQIFHDCVQVKALGDDVAELKYAPKPTDYPPYYELWHTEIVDVQFFCDLNDGIEISLYDWWLSDVGFSIDYEEFKECRDISNDSMIWDLIEFWETWHDVDCDGTIKELSAKETLQYNEAKNKLLVDHKKQRAAIEVEAVKIGL